MNLCYLARIANIKSIIFTFNNGCFMNDDLCQVHCFKMKSALVTGGGGYIGGRLCSALVDKRYAVTSLDIRFSSGEENQGIKRVKVQESTNVWCYSSWCLASLQGDIRDQSWLLSTLQEAKVDVVFHVASFGMSGRDMVSIVTYLPSIFFCKCKWHSNLFFFLAEQEDDWGGKCARDKERHRRYCKLTSTPSPPPPPAYWVLITELIWSYCETFR